MTGAPASGTARALALLSDPRFLLVWVVGGLTGMVRWLHLLVLGIYTFEITRSPFLVSVVPMLWMLPLALCGPAIGVLADRVNRKTLFCGFLAMVLATSITLALAALHGVLDFPVVVAASLASGVFWATDFPIRRRLLGDLVRDDLATAMALDSITSNATRMAGPVLGGVILQWFSLTGVFVLSTMIYSVCLVAMLAVSLPAAPVRAARALFLAELAAGLRFVAGDALLRRVLAITIVFNLFGFPFISMIPVIGADHLALGPAMVGLLSSTEGFGAFVGAFVISITAQPRWYSSVYAWGTTLYVAMVGYVGVLAHVAGGPYHSFFAASAALFAIGIGGACFAAMQSTLSYLGAPPEYRSRVLGVLTLCVGTGPIGFLNIGWMAESFGAPAALAISSAEGLFALLALWVFGSRAERGETSPAPA